jgi:uncharacterized membrane protein (DUF485 family)
MSDDTAVEIRLSPDEAEQLMHRVMQRQGRLSLRVAAVFLVLLLAIPLVNFYAPKIVQIDVFGFTLAWLILAVLFYPLTWVLSSYFVKQSDLIEAQIVKEERKS